MRDRVIPEWASGFMSVSAVRDALPNLDAAVARLRALLVEERAHHVLDKHVARVSPRTRSSTATRTAWTASAAPRPLRARGRDLRATW